MVVDLRLAVFASLEFLDVEGAFPKIALTSNESRPSLSPDLLKSHILKIDFLIDYKTILNTGMLYL